MYIICHNLFLSYHSQKPFNALSLRHHCRLGTSIWDIFKDFYAIPYIKFFLGTRKYECTYLEMVADFSCFLIRCFFSLLIVLLATVIWMPWKILNPWNHFFNLCNWDIIVILAGVIWTSPMISISYLTLRFLRFFSCRSKHRLLTGHTRIVLFVSFGKTEKIRREFGNKK